MTNLPINKLQAIDIENLPHAWLFTDGDYNDQLQTAQNFSNWLVCSNKQQMLACNQCKNCLLFAAATHPDVSQVTLEAENSSILVDAIRAVNEFAQAKPQLATHKIVIIYPAEKMNLQASNALLKTLEEPPPQTIIFLLTRHKAMLLPTLASRCTVLRFQGDLKLTTNDQQQVEQVLQDLQQLYLTKSTTALQLVEVWVKRGSDEMLYWFELILADLILTYRTQDFSLARFIKDRNNLNLVQAIGPRRIWIMLQKVQQARFWFGTGQKPNLQLLLEDIFL